MHLFFFSFSIKKLTAQPSFIYSKIKCKTEKSLSFKSEGKQKRDPELLCLPSDRREDYKMLHAEVKLTSTAATLFST